MFCSLRFALLVVAGLLPAVPALAHHGWGVFRVETPVYVEGVIAEVYWGNPHPTVTITVERPAAGTPWTAWRPPAAWLALGAAPALERVTVQPDLVGTMRLEFGSLHRQSALGFPEAPAVGERLAAIVFLPCDGSPAARSAVRIVRPTLVEYRGEVLSQQSHRLPAGCSGRRTADFD